MSILNHIDASHRPDDEVPEFKARCCMKYTIEKQCKRCPFRQIHDQEAQDKALSQCWDKRRGDYNWHDEKSGKDITIEYNNNYR